MTIALYRRYRQALRNTPITGQIMPYGWSRLPAPLDARWMPYSLMLEEFSRGLANTINDLTHHERSLRAWATVVASLSDRQKLAANHEFIDTLGTVAANLPYVIRARFAFAAAHLCHQANQLKTDTWSDDLPLDADLNLNEASVYGRGWARCGRLKQCLEKISGKDYLAGTQDFRNVYTHRLEPRFMIGFSQMVTRIVQDSGQVAYAIGAKPPLDLADVAELLAAQRDRCYRAFEAFQALVREQEAAIAGTNRI